MSETVNIDRVSCNINLRIGHLRMWYRFFKFLMVKPLGRRNFEFVLKAEGVSMKRKLTKSLIKKYMAPRSTHCRAKNV